MLVVVGSRAMMSGTLAVGLATNATLGFAFAMIAYTATFLMLHLWGYPYDKTRRKSEAPSWAMWLHRGLGYAFVVLYVVMMWQMVPRLWTYQIELPARTVAHLLLGFTVGFLLLLKIAILRFFRHLEEWMPFLGVGILLCTTLLLALSLPSALREHALAHGAPDGDPFGAASRARVARLVLDAALPAGTDLAALATEDSLQAGRVVLIEQCTTCHDLKTVLDRPRPPSTWADLVARMAEKPTLYGTIHAIDQARVTAYLIAITPDLQRSAKRRRAQAAPEEDELFVDAGVGEAAVGLIDAGPVDAGITDANVADSGPAHDAGVTAGVTGDAGVAQPPPVEPAQARTTFQRKCSGCHETADVDASPPRTTADARALLKRMIGNGLKATRRELALIAWWLDAHYVRGAM